MVARGDAVQQVVLVVASSEGDAQEDPAPEYACYP